MIEYDADEPVRGLPAQLPEGEDMLWQGAPDWRTLAQQAFCLRWIALYFAALTAWYLVDLLTNDAGLPSPGLALPPLLISAAVVMLLVVGFSWAVARTTVYTITSKRIVMRFGVALPMTWNIPFARLDSVDLRRFADGAGEVMLTPMAEDHFAYLVMWPHVRAWRLAKTQPSLRCLANVTEVGGILAAAIAAAGQGTTATPAPIQSNPKPHDLGHHAPQAA